MSRARIIAVVLAATAALAGCGTVNGLFDPYETVPLPAKPHAASLPGTRIGICYDFMLTSKQKVLAAGQAVCGPGTTAVRVDTDYQMMNCPVLLPGRATFVCTPKTPKK